MKKEDLIKLKEQISSLNNDELKLRDLYLKRIANGTFQGPQVGYPSIDKPWLQFYGDEDLSIDIPQCKAYDFLLTNNFNYKNQNAINFLNTKITYGQLFDKIEDTTKALYKLGVREGDIVTLIMPICPETVYLFYALDRLGAVVNSINPLGSYEDLKDEVSLTKSQHIFSIDMCHDNVDRLKDEMGINNIVYINPLNSAPFYLKKAYNLKNKYKNYDDWDRFIKDGKSVVGNIDSNYKKDTVLAIVHTGGTTGKPKGVQLTNEDFVAMAAMYKDGGLNFKRGETFLNFLPPFIAWCLCNGINMPLTLGANVTLVPKFQPEDFPKLMDKYKPNHVLSGPILWELMMKSDVKDLSYLKSPVSGGDALQVEAERRINDYFKKLGCEVEIAQGYGMTEVGSSATYCVNGSYKEGTVGIPNNKNVISAFDDNGNEVMTGEEGELWISTPSVMKGYYNNPEETEKVIFIDDFGTKWVKTADIGIITPDGHIQIKGRKKRIIVRAGQKIFPVNDENVILKNKNIETCSYVGVPDDVDRCVPALHIVLSEDCECSLEEIVEQIKEAILKELPCYDIPKYFIFRDELPKTNINKVDVKSLEAEELPIEEITDKRNNKKLTLKALN